MAKRRTSLPFWASLSYHFLMKIILMVSLLAFIGCGKQGSDNLHKIQSADFTKFVNQNKIPSDPNLSLDKSIVNNSYPIQIALYQDGRFYYDLPNLGDGRGTWKNSGGVIELHAKRTLFDMFIEIKANEKEAKTLSIQFTDRFGPNTLKMSNINI
jgi:hypothetical protein